MNDEHFMRLALQEAQESLVEGGLPVGAVVVLKGEVLGKGRNVINIDYHLGHAETNALDAALRNKQFRRKEHPMVLYTTLEPCLMCFGTILHCPISRLVYALEDPYGGATSIEVGALPVRHRDIFPQIEKGLLRAESKQLIKEFLLRTQEPFWLNKENPMVKLGLSDN